MTGDPGSQRKGKRTDQRRREIGGSALRAQNRYGVDHGRLDEFGENGQAGGENHRHRTLGHEVEDTLAEGLFIHAGKKLMLRISDQLYSVRFKQIEEAGKSQSRAVGVRA